VKLRNFVLLALTAVGTTRAEVTLPRVLGNHMVVQRGLPVHVWGLATPGETVVVRFRGETRSGKAGDLGRWSIFLSPGRAGGPFQLTVAGVATGADVKAGPAQTITLSDVMVGDVWVASGQSNMEYSLDRMARAQEDLPHAAEARQDPIHAVDTQLRLLLVKDTAAMFPQDDVNTDGWAVSSPETAAPFSAVAWYFAREIEKREHVPVGVIESTWGGTPVQAWTRMGALGSNAALMPVFEAWAHDADRDPDAELAQRDRDRQTEAAKVNGKTAPQFPPMQSLINKGPALLYNGMIAPLTPFAIRGVIWYQGEANAAPGLAPLYGPIFRTMIEDWRRQWGTGDFPFLFVQLPNYIAAHRDWPTIREQQLRTLELRNTGMAVTVDIGEPENLHPTDKIDVGQRLALAARALSYGEDVEYSGPVFRQATQEGSSLRLWFDHAQEMRVKGEALTGFEVAGADGKFQPAIARLDGVNVVVSSLEVAEPVYVRYGWANSPVCNLYNGDGLPAAPFTSAP
jgi:sialate O-acetylesterase